jgi:putative ABC transport system permease protein
MIPFLRLLTYVRRTVLRARTRSLLTILGTALAMGLFAFVRTLEGGVDRLSTSSNLPVLVVFQTSRFCPLTSELPVRYADDIRRMDGVESVLPTLLYINACRTNLDLVTLHGVVPDQLGGVHSMRLLEGDLESWKGRRDGALVGKRLAERRGLKPGDNLRLGAVNVQVGGIVESAGAGLDNVAFVHLDLLQLARKKPGKATEFIVRLKPGADPGSVARAIDDRFRGDETVTDTKTMQAFVQGAVGEVAEVVGFGRLLGYLAVAVVVLILGNTVYISAQTRVAELGVMETVGATRPMLGGLILVESLMLSLVGGVLGVGAVAAWLALSPKTLGIEGIGIDLVPEPSLALVGLGVSLLVGLLAAVGPAVEVLRRPLALAVKPT